MKVDFKGSIKVEDLQIDNLQIGKHKTVLNIKKAGMEGRGLRLNFSCGFEIFIHDDGRIVFQRSVIRPSHDHDNEEDLLLNETTGKIEWGDLDNFKYSKDKIKKFEVDFGPIIVGY